MYFFFLSKMIATKAQVPLTPIPPTTATSATTVPTITTPGDLVGKCFIFNVSKLLKKHTNIEYFGVVVWKKKPHQSIYKLFI